MNDFNEINRMTVSEYFTRMEAYMLQKSDKEELIHLQAWVTQMAKATTGSKKHSKPKFKKFEEFYNQAEVEKKIRDEYESGIDTPERVAKRKRTEIGRKIDRELAQRNKERGNSSSKTILFKTL